MTINCAQEGCALPLARPQWSSLLFWISVPHHRRFVDYLPTLAALCTYGAQDTHSTLHIHHEFDTLAT